MDSLPAPASPSGTRTTALRGVIQARLQQGPLLAADFMALALYHPVHGYYRQPQGPWGFAGKDYYTALDCGPLLGQTLALRLEKVWEALDRPSVFTVLEPGAGRGWLGRDLLEAAQGAFRDALRYVHRDDNPAARVLAQEALEPWLKTGQAACVSEATCLPPFVGAVVSNELFDALPAQPYRYTQGAWHREALTDKGPAWLPAEPDAATAWFEAQGPLEEGDGASWVEALPTVLRDHMASLSAGLFIAVDYGDTAARLLAKGADLRCYRGHRVDGDWWEHPGESDLTADVDFTRLSTLLERAGCSSHAHVSLSSWVRQHAPLQAWETTWQTLEPKERLRRMENLFQLTLSTAMGARFMVLEGVVDEHKG